MISEANFNALRTKLQDRLVTLVAVSKTKTTKEILTLYKLGQRDFGENYVQELLPKYEVLPKDIKWHFLGHLQTNKVKYIAPFIHLIQSVDSLKLLQEINTQAQKQKRIIDCLLEVKVGQESTKTGITSQEAGKFTSIGSPLENVQIKGLMGIASNSQDLNVVQKEFKSLKSNFEALKKIHSSFSVLSIGMTNDYELALNEGSTMVRLGTLLFGTRN